MVLNLHLRLDRIERHSHHRINGPSHASSGERAPALVHSGHETCLLDWLYADCT